MKIKIKVLEVLQVSNKNIFNVTVEGDKYLIGDIFVNHESNLKFELKGIAMENNPESVNKSITVVPTGKYSSIEEYLYKTFEKDKT